MNSPEPTLPPPGGADDTPWSSRRAFVLGARTGLFSVFAPVLFGTFIGYGALCHDFGFSLLWALVSTALVWAGPAQVIVVTTVGAGAPAIESAIAVGLSGMRLLPMVAALLPVIRTPATRLRDLVLPAHFTAASMWVEGLRVAPTLPRERRIAFCNGLGTMMTVISLVAATIGFAMASRLPTVIAAAVLFLTPMSFLVSVARNSKLLVDRLAFAFGLVFTPVFIYAKVNLGLLLAGLAAGTLAYGAHWLRMRR
jgi:predicted branched-subunit amino acid permease